MDQVKATELRAALILATARPGALAELVAAVRGRADDTLVDSVAHWAAADRGPGDDERVRILTGDLAEAALLRPLLARELRRWLGATLTAADRSSRPDRPGHIERGDDGEQADRSDHIDRIARVDRVDRLDRVENSIGTSARIDGPVVQAHDVHGGVHFHAPPAAPAPPRAPTVPRQILPVPEHFTNRRRELEELESVLRSGGRAPVVAVISGPAGIGKTSLACRCLLDLADACPQGQLYVDLRAHSDSGPAEPGEILAELLRALGHEQIPLSLNERAALWRSVAVDARIGLLLDNALSAAQVRPLLPGSAGSLTVVTSRRRLTGLGLDGAVFCPLDVLDTQDALEILRRRIGAERVHREPAAALAMVEASAGLPLAVSVTAARLAARPRQPLSVMAAALRDGGERALDALRVEGDYAVRTALDESYRLLTPDLARFYRRLSLAPVPVLSAPVAAAACAVPPAGADLLLDELAEVSLVEDLGPDPRTGLGRYRFHDLVRTHARGMAARSETTADATGAVRNTVEFYLRAATAAEELLSPTHRTLARDYERPAGAPPPFTEAPGALRWLDAERSHLMAVLRTADARGWDAACWQLADAMWPLFLRLRPYELWIEAHERGLAAARRAGDGGAVRRMLTSGGAGLRNAGQYAEAVEWFREALDAAREDVASLASTGTDGGTGTGPGTGRGALLAARRTEAQALHGLGQTLRLAGHTAEALEYFDAALVLREEIGHRRGAALTRLCRGDIALEQGRPDDALPDLRRARDELLAVDDPYDAARALAFLGLAHGQASAAARTAPPDRADRAAESEALLRAALAEFEDTGSVHWQGRVLALLGRTAEERGDRAAAREWYALSLARYETVDREEAARVRELWQRVGADLGPPDPS
ncbi:ATP-binding protein [Streptomyces yaizuensis]|uniref:Tetratricopeptide repeat protein n=1 Tax=Streptomyces yaizuensis TaxID=2989713 RepID=A0ABQ5P1U7_9ACTN|nr:tetratricopeptide repeat protein [Streptomyces sp. YSPA8]GLF96571.1 tetratricopeptide repeat protein [Streptomyces sp. YSPA8]